MKKTYYNCQNTCKYADNSQGKWIKHWWDRWRWSYRHPKGIWHIYCTKHGRFYRWHDHKPCYKRIQP